MKEDDGFNSDLLTVVESPARVVLALEPVVEQLARCFGREGVIPLAPPALHFVCNRFWQSKTGDLRRVARACHEYILTIGDWNQAEGVRPVPPREPKISF